MLAEMRIGFRIDIPLLLCDFDWNFNRWTDFSFIIQGQIKKKSAFSLSMTDRMILTGTSQEFEGDK
jgi:hypothetical protein